MPKITDKQQLSEQYATDKRLAARARLHQLYNVNQQPLWDWFFENISIPDKPRILEIGCGNGSLWTDHLKSLPVDAELVLTDFSSGMVEIVKKKFRNDVRVEAQTADVQQLPFHNESFDIIIANHTLHHVEDINKALEEIHRVLAPNGLFYATANGINGLENYLHQAIQRIEADNKAFADPLPFNLKNGEDYLKLHFNKVCFIEFPNALAITKTQYLIAWIDSTRDMQPVITDELLKKLTIYFDSILQANGKIDIPKQVGLLIASC